MANSPDATTRGFDPMDGDELDLINDPTTQVARVFVFFLQNLFRTFPEGYGLKWRPDEETTELIITGEKPTLEAIEKTPHITCVLGACRWANSSLDQFQNSRASDGRRIHTDLLSSTMAYHCQAKNGLLARRLAWYASKYTNVFARVIQRGGKLHHVLRAHTLGAETPPTAFTGNTAETELVESIVTVPFYWQDGWSITRPAPLLQKVSIDLNVNEIESMYSAGRSNLIRRPRVKGVPVTTTPIDRGVAYTQVVLVDNFGEEE